MFTKSQTGAKLDAEIISVLETLENLDKTSEEYGDLVDRIVKLHKLKMEEHPQRISADTALVVAANIFGILLITHYEHENPITTRALSLIMKPR